MVVSVILARSALMSALSCDVCFSYGAKDFDTVFPQERSLLHTVLFLKVAAATHQAFRSLWWLPPSHSTALWLGRWVIRIRDLPITGATHIL